jgi:molecular chaperone DnaK
MGDQLESEEKERIETAAKELEETLKGDDKEQIEAKSKALSEASAKMAEKLYAQNSGTTKETSGHDGHSEDDVVDAEFEDISNDK